MRFGVVIFPGSNCDRDCLYVMTDVLGQEAIPIWHRDSDLTDVDAIILPGGFSYGDYLRSGALASHSPVMQAVMEFAARGGLVLGICNGFQILLECGLLPGAMRRNMSLRFRCHPTYLRVETVDTPFTSRYLPGQVVQIPIAHGEGNYYIDAAGLDELVAHDQIVFRYCDSNGNLTDSANPNGSTAHIAGICNRERNVLGMMPHPERSSETLLGSADGRLIFTSMLDFLQKGNTQVAQQRLAAVQTRTESVDVKAQTPIAG